MRDIRSMCIVGKKHQSAMLSCQDSVNSARCGSVRVISLSDGTGNDMWATVGAKITCYIAAHYCAEHFFELIEKTKDEIRNEFICSIRSAIFHMKQDLDMPIKSFAATCIVAAADMASGKLLCLHLGDGYIVAKEHTGGIQIISHPTNGIDKCHTDLTTSFRGTEYIKIIIGNVHPFSELLLFSDGWSREIENGDEKSKKIDDAREMASSILQCLSNDSRPCSFEDDISAISLRFMSLQET